MKKWTNKKISDKDLKQWLSSMKEEVAAPSNFRAQILKKLAAQNGQALPETAQTSLLDRALQFLSRPVLAPLAAAALVGFAIWASTTNYSVPQTGSAQSFGAASEQVKVASAPQEASKPGLSKAPQAPQPKALALASSSQSQSAHGAAPAQSTSSQQRLVSAPAPAPNGVAQFASGVAPSSAAAAQAAAVAATVKPTIIVVTEVPTPMAHPLSGNSEVRRNKFQASKGEYAAILYELKASSHVRVEIFDRLGHLIALLQDGVQGPGMHEIHWMGYDDKGDLAATGIYLVRIKCDSYDERHKIVLIR